MNWESGVNSAQKSISDVRAMSSWSETGSLVIVTWIS